MNIQDYGEPMSAREIQNALDNGGDIHPATIRALLEEFRALEKENRILKGLLAQKYPESST